MSEPASLRHRSSAHRRSRSRSRSRSRAPRRHRSRSPRSRRCHDEASARTARHSRSSANRRSKDADHRRGSSSRHRRHRRHSRGDSPDSRHSRSPAGRTADGDRSCEETRRVVLVQKKQPPELNSRLSPSPEPRGASCRAMDPEPQSTLSRPEKPELPPASAAAPASSAPTGLTAGCQILVSEATRRRIACGAAAEPPEAAAGVEPPPSPFGKFGRPAAAATVPDAAEPAGSGKAQSGVAADRSGATEGRVSAAKRKSADRRRYRSRSRSSSGSDVSIRRADSRSGGLKIDKKRLRRKAIENTVLRLGERCPQRLAAMPCFRALGVKISELERICRKLLSSENEKNQEKLSSAINQNKDSFVSVGSIGPVRHPFQLAEPVDASPLSAKAKPASRFGQPALAGQKQQLLAEFPVSSGAFHRNTTDEAEGPSGGGAPSAQQLTSFAAAAAAAADLPFGIECVNGSCSNNEALNSAQLHSQSLSTSLSSSATVEVNKDRLLAIADWAASRPQPQVYQQLQQQTRSRSPQAWVKKHQLLNAQPITGGIGHHLMQKMGWRDGQGLGKRNEGPTEPLAIDYKTDRKGLASLEDRPTAGKKKKSGQAPAASTAAASNAAAAAVSGSALQCLNGKHPICALLEAARKRRLPEPQFRLVHQSGPAHSPCFVFSVQVGSIEYQPTRPCGNKKDAKASAATLALQQLGLVPKI